MNALRNSWRRDPWTPGQTIELCEHEERFQTESGLARLSEPIAPAVVDWLRWKYRRLQVDRRRDSAWARVVREEYPHRVREAGPAPAGYDSTAPGRTSPLWTAYLPVSRSKRLLDDAPRAPTAAARAARKSSSLDDIEVSEEVLARVAYQQRDVLAPLLSLCAGPCEQRMLIRELAIYLDRPTDLAAVRSWTSFVSMLRERA